MNAMKPTTQIPELQALIVAVEKTFGEEIRTTAAFERLAAALEATLKEGLGASTLKRIWGYVPDGTTPRLSTLDILARYAGYDSFKAFRKESIGGDSSDFITGWTCITSDELQEGDRVALEWLPDRRVTLRYKGDALFEVEESAGSKLRRGDIIECSCLLKGWPLMVPYILRDGRKTPPYIAGKANGITLLEKL